MPVIVNGNADIENLQKQVRKAARVTLEKISKVLQLPYMEAFHQFRFDKQGRRPLEDHPLTITEQLNQSFHALATLAAAKRLLNDHSDCGGLELNLTIESGRDIKSTAKNANSVALLEAEVFATVDTNYNKKLSAEIDSLSKCPRAKHRFVFFYCPNADHKPNEPWIRKAKDANVTICRLEKNELLEELRTLAAEPASVDEARALRGIGWEGDLDAMRSHRTP